MSVIKISILGMITVLMVLQFKETKSEYGTMIMLVASVLIFGFGISKIRQIIELINSVKSDFGIASGYVGVMIKIVGISYVCEFSADICRDSGMSTLANQIQIFGKLSIFVTGIPIFVQLLEAIGTLL